MSAIKTPSPLQKLQASFLEDAGVELWIKRDDLIHPEISGNKWRKLKYNLQQLKMEGHQQLLTYGGAYSNHISAVAAAGALYGVPTIGVIRGEELSASHNPTLQLARAKGMQLHFVSRSEYRLKKTTAFQESLKNRFGAFYEVPEGGSNSLAVKGSAEILDEISLPFDWICCAVGTGGTIAGLIQGLQKGQRALGFSALKGGDFLRKDINALTNAVNANQWELNTEWHFGAYAKVDQRLIDFARNFHQTFSIQLDLIYTAKMFFGLFQEIKSTSFPRGSKIIAVHTGGLQGNRGMEEKLGIQLYDS